MAERNPAAELLEAVASATREYQPDDDLDFEGRVVAIECDDESEARDTVEVLESIGYGADVTEHDGVWFAWISDLAGTDPNDAIFEIGWHGFRAGSIPDPRVEEEE